MFCLFVFCPHQLCDSFCFCSFYFLSSQVGRVLCWGWCRCLEGGDVGGGKRMSGLVLQCDNDVCGRNLGFGTAGNSCRCLPEGLMVCKCLVDTFFSSSSSHVFKFRGKWFSRQRKLPQDLQSSLMFDPSFREIPLMHSAHFCVQL